MEKKKWIYIGLVFVVIAVVSGIITVFLMPLAPEYFDPENIYSILAPTFMIITFMSVVLGGMCFFWWFWSRRFKIE